jgi:hypothetical protein
MDKLKEEARESAESRGHELGPWKNCGTMAMADCEHDGCSAWVCIDTNPGPNSIGIGGTAVAMNCPYIRPWEAKDE